MARIEVNHGDLSATASEIRKYVEIQDRQMVAAKQAMNQLFNSWTGSDAMNLQVMWGDIDSNDSIVTTFRKNLVDYADAIEQCAKIYKNAQENVINLANAIL